MNLKRKQMKEQQEGKINSDKTKEVVTFNT